MTLGSELRAARTRAGLSLAELGEKVGVSPATLSRWETGRGTPSPAVLQRGAAVLKVDLRPWLESGPATAEGKGVRSVPTASGTPRIDDWRQYETLDLDPILSAALESFLRLGYHGTTVRHVARAAGMSVPNMYHHYANKQALLVAIMDRTMNEFWHRCEMARTEGRDAEERFRLLVECFALFHTHRQELAFIGASEMRSLEPVERRRVAQIRTDCQRMVDRELAMLDLQGRLGKAHREDAGRAVVTMLVGIASWYHPPGPQEPEAIARLYVDFAEGLVGLTRRGDTV